MNQLVAPERCSRSVAGTASPNSSALASSTAWLARPHGSGARRITLALVSGSLGLYCALAESLVPPPKPAVAPLIAESYPNDGDRDRVDDQLASKARQAFAAQKAAATAEQKSLAEAALGALTDVELVFKQPVTQHQIDRFLGLGGEITYLYKALSYGWHGRIPLGKVSDLPAAMGGTLVLIDGPTTGAGALLEATRSGRVRSIWTNGFARGSLGFEGTTNITLAILDNGVDDTPPDLAGRVVYRQNFTDEPWPTSGLHGTHSAGVALGIGVAGESHSGTLLFTAITGPGDISLFSNVGFMPAPFEIPNGVVTVAMTGQWDNGGSTTMSLASYDTATQRSNLTTFNPVSGTSPLTLTAVVTGDVRRVFTPKLNFNASMSNTVVTWSVSNYPGSGDWFNRLRGVAPGCNYADAKIGYANGWTPTFSWAEDAMDDLTYRRVEDRIKVMSLAWIAGGSPGINVSLRQKINSAVNNGILLTLAAGNGGSSSTETGREISDPGRAAFGLTVGGASDRIQLIAQSSQGFDSPGSTLGQEEDYKPDLIAPSGSGFETLVLAPDDNLTDSTVFPEQQVNDYVGMMGTSVATAFAAGCAALVIEAMERAGIDWDFTSARHPLFVKMLLCATASESNLPRWGNRAAFDSPTLERAANGPSGFPSGKDRHEGYGMINPDAAVEAACLAYTNGVTYSDTLGPTPNDRRVWARKLTLASGKIFVANIAVPSAGDFDLYLYSAEPGLYGNPVILASSTQAGINVNESLNYLPPTNTSALLVVKRVSGSGPFSLLADVAPPPLLACPSPDGGGGWVLSFETLAGRSYSVEYKDSLNEPAWQQLGAPVLGDGNLKGKTDSILAAGKRFYRLKVQ